MPKYWRITAQHGRKAHLSEFKPDQGSGNVALCGKPLPENLRRGSAMTINEPIGNECEVCLRKAGHLNRTVTAKERQLQATANAVRFLIENLGLKSSDVVDVLDAARRFAGTNRDKAVTH